jgi:hypothetical protein
MPRPRYWVGGGGCLMDQPLFPVESVFWTQSHTEANNCLYRLFQEQPRIVVHVDSLNNWQAWVTPVGENGISVHSGSLSLGEVGRIRAVRRREWRWIC